MLYWTIIFFILAALAALLGFGGLAGTFAQIAQFLAVLFVVLFVISLLAAQPYFRSSAAAGCLIFALLGGKTDRKKRAAMATIGGGYASFQEAHDFPAYREAKAGAGVLLVAALQARVFIKHFLEFGLRDAGTVIGDADITFGVPGLAK